jgi:hypothetical protein
MRNACYNVVVKPTRGGKFGRLESIWYENIKMDLKCVRMWTGLSVAGQGPEAGACGNVKHCRIQ